MNIATDTACTCMACQHGMEGLSDFEHNAVRKFGWWVHLLTESDPSSPTGFNMHTHGVAEFYGHTDFQCVFPHIDPSYIMAFWNDMINDIKQGQRFLPDIDYPGYAEDGYFIRFIEAVEDGRPVLRMLIPNTAGRYEAEKGCSCYVNQLNV